MNEIFLDTETTGLSFKEGHRIVEIACIETKDLIPTDNFFHKLINPMRNVPDEAFNIHGFSTKFLNDKAPFSQIADEFLDFINGKKIIIHNANFDLNFINGELSALNKKLINKNEVIDSLEVARNKFPGLSNSLDALCKRFSIDLSKRVKHNAVLDCQLLREVYINLLDAKEPKLNLSSTNTNHKDFSKVIKSYSKKILKLSESDLKKHSEFIKSDLKKNFY